MANYIKVNPKVAIHCGLRGVRPILPDGNSALWINDLSHFGRMADRAEILPRIGGVWLSGPQLREEQQGRLVTPLPEPAEERFALNEEERREFYPRRYAVQPEDTAVAEDEASDVDGSPEENAPMTAGTPSDDDEVAGKGGEEV